MRAAFLLGFVTGCSLQPSPAKPHAQATEPVVIVASEHGPHGIRLVAIDEHGDRRFELVAPATTVVQDKNPAVSPDGRWLVFASTRGRAGVATSLWIAPVGVEQQPRRITDGIARDVQPVWSPDGRSVVFASTRARADGRDGGDFDLWQLAIDRDGRPGATLQLTHETGHEVQPTIAPDGTIVYAAVTQIGEREVDSRLVERAPDGTLHVLTSGPADNSPAFSPDGKTLVFARPVMHMGEPHAKLWRMTRGSEQATAILALPLTDESGPVWSRDGRFVFATSVLRAASGRTLFSSVVHVDLLEKQPRARILGDRAGAVERLTPAISAPQLDVAALHADPEYLPELARIMAKKLAEQSHE